MPRLARMAPIPRRASAGSSDLDCPAGPGVFCLFFVLLLTSGWIPPPMEPGVPKPASRAFTPWLARVVSLPRLSSHPMSLSTGSSGTLSKAGSTGVLPQPDVRLPCLSRLARLSRSCQVVELPHPTRLAQRPCLSQFAEVGHQMAPQEGGGGSTVTAALALPSFPASHTLVINYAHLPSLVTRISDIGLTWTHSLICLFPPLYLSVPCSVPC